MIVGRKKTAQIDDTFYALQPCRLGNIERNQGVDILEIALKLDSSRGHRMN